MLQHADHLEWVAGPDTAAQMTARHWQAPAPLLEALNARLGPAGVALEVYANQGRWIVECPDCHGAQLASPTDRRFMCNCCANAAVGGVWRAVVWPRQVAAIEALLADRPVENRNWLPGESLKQLRAENTWFMKGGS